jgi:hypothetical protein
MTIVGNTFDGTGAAQNYNGIVIQAAGNNTGTNVVVIADNIVRGNAGSNMSNGIVASGGSRYLIEGNYVERAAQTGIYLDNIGDSLVKGNHLRRCGSVADAFRATACHNVHFYDNNTDTLLWDGSAFSDDPTGAKFTEAETTGMIVNTNGVTVTRTGGNAIFPQTWWAGKTVTINGVDYTVQSVTDYITITLTSAAGVQTGVNLATKFSANIYGGNRGRYNLLPTGTSKVVSAREREIRASYTPTQIGANQDNYSIHYPYYRLNLSSDAARNITGFMFGGYPAYYDMVDGQEHQFYNAGSFDITLVHQSGSSTAANRFACSIGANIVLAPGQSAMLTYNTAISRWMVRPASGVMFDSAGNITIPDLTYLSSTGSRLIGKNAGGTAVYFNPDNVAAAQIGFGTDITFGAVGGASAAKFDLNAGAGNTRFLIYDVDNGTLERVTVGSADSGGAGFKVLRIPN